MREVVSPELARYYKYADEINARRRKLYAEDEWYRNKEKKRHHEKYLKKIKENNVAEQDSKKDITNELNRLKDFGFLVITFNDSRPLRSSQKNFVDHFITNGKYIVFVETKLTSTKDKLSEGQKRTGDKLSSASVWNKYTHMKYLKTTADARRLVELLLRGEL